MSPSHRNFSGTRCGSQERSPLTERGSAQCHSLILTWQGRIPLPVCGSDESLTSVTDHGGRYGADVCIIFDYFIFLHLNHFSNLQEPFQNAISTIFHKEFAVFFSGVDRYQRFCSILTVANCILVYSLVWKTVQKKDYV